MNEILSIIATLFILWFLFKFAHQWLSKLLAYLLVPGVIGLLLAGPGGFGLGLAIGFFFWARSFFKK